MSETRRLARNATTVAAGIVLVCGLGLSGPAGADSGNSGAYLAAHVAVAENDFRAAADYFTRALTLDPRNPYLLESTVMADVAEGDVTTAIPVARAMHEFAPQSQVGALVALVDDAKQGQYDALLAALDGDVPVGPLIGALFRAWSELGRGRMSEATTAFDAAADIDGMQAFALYHKALALASVGDFEGADAIFASPETEAVRATRRGVLAHAEILSQLERDQDAVALIDLAFGGDLDPALADMRARLVAGETLPFTIVTAPGDGFAEVLYTLAGALSTGNPDIFTLIYARLGEYLRPDHVDAILLTAGLLENMQQYDLANAVYNRIPRDDPSFHMAELGRAQALMSAGKAEAAIEVLEQLTKSHGDLPDVWIALGDTLRQSERFDEAARAYDEAIARFTGDDEAQWSVYYARGISLERVKNWDKAEPDFRKALALRPDQPQVLNYLGYSFLEMNTNLDEALSMIERAVAARPDDGYIVDSLAWALYRLGRYQEAVEPMEKAIELMPVDSLVNDHLGDIYWAVGRKREAEFQWRRALSFEPETEADATRIRRKLEVGLDKVLAEEGAAPLAVTQNGN